MSLILPRRFKSQPQVAVEIADEFRAYKPKIAVLPSSGINLISNAGITFVNDAVIRNGNFNFPGVNGYVDLGSETHIGSTDYTVIVVSRPRTISSFPVIFGLKSSGFGNLMGFYDTGSYKDIAIGNGGTSSGEIYSLSKFGSVAGTWHNLVYVKRTTGKLFCNGSEAQFMGTAGLGGSTGNNCLGQLNPGSLGNDFVGDIALFAVFNGVLPDHLALKVSADPWSLFESRERRLWIAPDVAAGYTLTANSGSFSVSGTDASLEFGRLLTADSGSFTVTGTAVTVGKGYGLLAESGSFAVTGTAATLAYGRVLPCDAGSFQVNGTDASLEYGRVLTAGSGSFAVTGQDANLVHGVTGSYTLTANPGAFSITGADAGLTATRYLSADGGAFSITGTPAAFALTRYLSAEPGSFSVSGTDASLNRGRTLTAESGSFAFSGQTATLRYARAIIAEAGQFAMTGTDALLTLGNRPVSDVRTYAVPAENRVHIVRAENRTYRVPS